MRRSDLRAALLMVGALSFAGCDCIGPAPYGPDAGRDAGHKDAGAPDAGERDAGMDAGVTDAGETVHATTSGGGSVNAPGGAHALTSSIGAAAAGSATGPAHQAQLGILRATQAK